MTTANAELKRTAPQTKANLTTDTRAASISPYGPARSTVSGAPLSPEELEQIDAYWRASLYLCLGDALPPGKIRCSASRSRSSTSSRASWATGAPTPGRRSRTSTSTG